MELFGQRALRLLIATVLLGGTPLPAAEEPAVPGHLDPGTVRLEDGGFLLLDLKE